MNVSFDRLCQIEDRVSEYNWKPHGIFYTVEDIKKHIEPDIKASFNFAIWLLQKEAKTPQEKEARRYLMNVVNNYAEGSEQV